MLTVSTITAQQAADIEARLTKFNNWLGKRTSYKWEDIPADVRHVSNEERSQLEVYEFVHNPPERYFLYIRMDTDPAGQWNRTGIATTWAGEKLGDVRAGHRYRSNMGDVRVPVRIRAINGRTYVGTFYQSSGDYARVRLAKGADQETLG